MSGPRPRAGILEISPYVAGKAGAPGIARVFKLSANENALGASPKALAAYREAAAELHLYPDPNATELRAALAGLTARLEQARPQPLSADAQLNRTLLLRLIGERIESLRELVERRCAGDLAWSGYDFDGLRVAA